MKPRILMIAYACNPEGNGEHWLGWGWAEQASHEFEVHLITTVNHRDQVEERAARDGITPYFVGVPALLRRVSSLLGSSGSWLRKLAWQFRVARLAETLHREHHFGIVHQTTFHTFRVPFLAAKLAIPSVWGPIAGGESVPPGFSRYLGLASLSEIARHVVNQLWLLMPSVRWSLRRASVIFVSNRTTLNFLPMFCRAKCIVVPPNALRPEDESLPTPSTAPALRRGELHLLYVGNCVHTRALPIVFQALRQCEFQDFKLTVVGTGPALSQWKRLAARRGVSLKIEFAGQVPRDQLPELYAKAHALVFPALRDSGGSALLEAMSRGVPVICFDWAGPGEMVDAQSGVKVPVRHRVETIAALAAAFAGLRASPDLRLALARAGWERARTHFRWEAKKTLLTATYRRLLLKNEATRGIP